MRQWKRISLLTYIIPVLLLAAVLILVIYLIPDFGGRDPAVSTAVTESGTKDLDETPEATPEETDGTSDSTAGTYERGRPHKQGGRSDDDGSSQTDVTEEEKVYVPPTLFIATDLHYQSPLMTDFMASFDSYTKWSDGTVVPYLDQLTDAFLEEVVMQRPAALILSGDLSQNGEKVNHEELAVKLEWVQEAGIPVLVIPGNHDISHPWAASYFGEETRPAETVDAQGFYDIYHEFGYDQAESRDEESLSYLYCLDERYWLLMLDSSIYDPRNETGGRIKSSTLEWMRRQLDAAKEAGITVIPVAHHNLLDESTLYQEECTLENGRDVTALLEEYGLPVYFSGHLHLQRIKKHVTGPAAEGQYGIHEIVGSPLTMSPCQYGVLSWTEGGDLNYRTKQVDVEGWARRYAEEDENLLNFRAYAQQFLVDTVAEQAFQGMESIPEERKIEMAELYGSLNRAYCSGETIDARTIKQSRTYLYWSRYEGASRWFDRLTSILNDTKKNHNRLTLKAGTDFPVAGPADADPEQEQNAVKE